MSSPIGNVARVLVIGVVGLLMVPGRLWVAGLHDVRGLRRDGWK
jgi:hypothetical protein